MKAILTHPELPTGRAEPAVWFTADTHYGHAKMIGPRPDGQPFRPFATVEDMNEALIERWNAVVKPGDRVYHLGDFAFCKPAQAEWIARRLRGQKFLIFGNHDDPMRKHQPFLEQWIWARDLEQITVGDQKITLCHYAMRTWRNSHHGAWQLHGHSHGSLQDDSRLRQIDVGVDCWDYTPVSFAALSERMSAKTWAPIDHHGAA
jgi:calcineurin-like phosphoesterase family protein